MEMDVFVLVGLDPLSDRYVPLGCNESYSVMEKAQQESAETLRLNASLMNFDDRDKIERSIGSMAILPALLKFGV